MSASPAPKHKVRRTFGTSSPRHWLIHLARWGLVVVIVLAVRERHTQFVADERGRQEITASLAQIQTLLPDAAALGPADPQRGGRFVVDDAGETIGYVVQTLPAARRVVGYSGPNDLLLAFRSDGPLAGVLLLSSGDTPDHVALVRQETTFLASLAGSTWDELAALEEVDGVAGATLTSAAIAESIVHRLAGSQPSFRFPEALPLAAAQTLFPEAATLAPEPRGAIEVVDAEGTVLGLLLRTSPRSDNRIGYQGPTDGLLALDPRGESIVGIGIQRSYDNDRYVEDVTLDWTFLHRFDGMALDEFAGLSVGFGKDVEGVSGATMTSQTLVENLIEAARHFRADDMPARAAGDAFGTVADQLAARTRDIGTMLVVLIAAVIAFTDLRGKRWLRRVWQCVLIGYLGFLNADLLSQATFVGWAKNGLPWQIAPGLVLLAIATFLVPLTTRTQLYCHHLCPHGAAQELLRNRLPWRVMIPRSLEPWLSALPAALLVLVVVVVLWRFPLDLTGIEPFDAYAWTAAGLATLTIAITSLVASLFVPMAYCRFGCPTGALLSYLRRNGLSDRLTARDALAAVLALIALAVLWL